MCFSGEVFQIGTKYYSLHQNTRKNWQDAKNFCTQRAGGKLAQLPTSNTERQTLLNKLTSFSGVCKSPNYIAEFSNLKLSRSTLS